MPTTPSTLRLGAALTALEYGGVIACPTEAVWGLSCDPDNPSAVRRLLALKRRPVHKGLILVAANESQLGFLLTDLSQGQRQTLSDSWPGPSTWLIPHQGRVQPWIHGGHETVAVRVTAHPTMRALCEGFGGPLVSTSANPSGSQPPRERFQLIRYFGDELDAVLSGAVGDSRRPSLIRDLVSGKTIRS